MRKISLVLVVAVCWMLVPVTSAQLAEPIPFDPEPLPQGYCQIDAVFADYFSGRQYGWADYSCYNMTNNYVEVSLVFDQSSSLVTHRYGHTYQTLEPEGTYHGSVGRVEVGPQIAPCFTVTATIEWSAAFVSPWRTTIYREQDWGAATYCW